MSGAARRLTSGAARPEGLQDFASRHIVRAIVTGALRPGEKLSPTKLAEELSISHIPVREALAALEASGHVVREPRRGFFVAELSLGYVEDVYHWRQVLEDEAHRLAVPKLDKADLARMRKLNKDIKRVAPYSTRHVDLNREFHFVVFERAESEILQRFLNHLWDAATRYQSSLKTVAIPHAVFSDQHEKLIAAYEARDVALANRLMAEHRGVTLDAVRKMVSEPQAQGA